MQIADTHSCCPCPPIVRRFCRCSSSQPKPRVMAGRSRIEWTEATWNPVTGCDQVSPGCAHCYAKTFAERWRGIAGHPYEQGFDLRLWPSGLEVPLRWRKPRTIFVNSMTDLFHEDIPLAFIREVFETMRPRALAHLPDPDEARRAPRASSPHSSTGRRTCGWASASRTADSCTAPTCCGGARRRAVHQRRAAPRAA